MATNRLEEMKRKLLGQQNNKEKFSASIPQLQIPLTNPVPQLVLPQLPKDMTPQVCSKDPYAQRNQFQQPQGIEPTQPISGEVIQQQSNPLVSASQPAQQSELSTHRQSHLLSQLSHDLIEKEGPIDPVDPVQNIEAPPKDNQQVPCLQGGKNEDIGKKTEDLGEKGVIEEPANLNLEEKHPNEWCSVDDEAKGVHGLPESKVQKKQRKIVLKELKAVEECISNLKSAVKGLRVLQEKIGARPELKERLKVYLMELRKYQQGSLV